MPAKKKEVKHEEHVFVDEEGTFIHEAEGARYSGGTRRFNTGSDNSAAPIVTPSKTPGGHKGNANNHTHHGSTGQAITEGATARTGAGSAAPRGNAPPGSASASAGSASTTTSAPHNNSNSTPHVLRYRHGHGSYTSPTLHYVGQWVEDYMHGSGTLEFSVSGGRYTGDFVRGMFDGEGEYVWKDGSRYVGSWRANRMHGVGTYTDAEGNIWKGKFYNGTGPGLQKLYQEASLS